MFLFRFFKIVIFTLSVGFVQAALADGYAVDGLFGLSFSADASYEHAQNGEIALVWKKGGYAYRIGAMSVGKFELKEGSRDTFIDISAFYLEMDKRVSFGKTSLEIGPGIAMSQASAQVDGYKLADNKEDVNVFFSTRLVQEFREEFSLQLGWKYINDIHGENIQLLQMGARYAF